MGFSEGRFTVGDDRVGGKDGGSGLRSTLKDRQQAAQRLDEEVPAHLELSRTALQVAGRPPLCPASSVWPEAQPFPSLGLHLPPVTVGDILRCPCTHRFPRHGGPKSSHIYADSLWLDLRALFSLVFKCPLPNLSLGEGEPGEGG